MLQDFLPVAQFYLGEVRSPDGSISYLFGTQSMLERIAVTDAIHLDDTFKVSRSVYFLSFSLSFLSSTIAPA